MSGYLGVAERFRGRVPRKFLSAVFSKVQTGVLAADARRTQGISSRDYTYHTAHDWYGHERRARVETILGELGAEFNGVLVGSVPNKRGSRHTVIMLPREKILLTASAIRQQRLMVRASDFRRKHSATSFGNIDTRQQCFDIDLGWKLHPVQYDLSAITDDWIYGIILYSPSSANRYLTGAVDIGFPNLRYTGYVDYIELTPTPAQPPVTVASEPIPDHADVSLLLGEVGQDVQLKEEELEQGEIT